MRKGLAEIAWHVDVSRAANLRYLEALAVVGPLPTKEVLDPLSRPLHPIALAWIIQTLPNKEASGCV
jgi:hypothetical protein